MLRKLLTRGPISGLFLALVLALPVRAADEGVDYVALSPPQPTETGDKVEVLEVFWFGCPHCWHLEPTLETWVSQLPKGVAFRRMPATGPHWTPHARAYYAAEALGRLDAFLPALFKAMQVERRRIASREDLIAFAGSIGIDEKAFASAYDSFYVDAKVRKATAMGRRYGIDGVPAIIVDGKYRTSPSQTGGIPQMFPVLNSLVAKALADRQSGRGPAPVAGAGARPAPASGS